MRRLAGLFVTCTLLTVLASGRASGAPPELPTPGTAAQVAALVAASPSISSLPGDLLPPLAKAGSDKPGLYYPRANKECQVVATCVFGDLKSKASIVLFGDSHAQMWLPALVPVADALHVRLVILWDPGCPAADVPVWSSQTNSVNAACTAFRAAAIATIRKLDPILVLTADRTSDMLGPDHKFMSNATWESGLETTISQLRSTTTKVAVIGDITASNLTLPDCLAAYPSDVQRCSVPNPNPVINQHVTAEMAAATAEGVTYINPQPWLCTSKVCSPVIGTMVVYFDNEHVAATYAEYLSGVFGQAVKPLV